MKKLINKAMKNKLLTVLLILGTISIILGILFPAVITNDNKDLIQESIKTFISGIKEEKANPIPKKKKFEDEDSKKNKEKGLNHF